MHIDLGVKGPTIGRGLNGVLVAVLSVALAVPVSAMAADLTNSQTGADSTNENVVSVEHDSQVTVTNTANVSQNFSLNLNTGGNTIRNNTTVGDVSTGDVSFDISADTTVNDTTVKLPDSTADGLGAGALSFSNQRTGSGSNNTNTVNQSSTRTLNITNNLSVNTSVSVNANTGDNTIADNTKVGDISTGDISGQIAINTTGNTVDIGGKGGGVIPPDNGNGGNTGGNNGGSNGGGQTVVPGSTHTETIAAATPQTPTISGKGGGVYFPAGGNPNSAFQIFLLFLLTVAIVRFQSLLSAIGREIPLPVRC